MKLKFGMIVTDGVNKIGGNVISRNRYGRFARTYVIPADPRTSAQLSRRALFQTYALAWKSESFANQALWSAATANYPRTDDVGNIYYPSPQNLYIELNTNLVWAGSPAVHVPPVKVVPAAPPPFSLSVNETGASYDVVFAPPYNDATIRLFLKATVSLNAGRHYISTELRNIYSLNAAALAAFPFRPQYVAYFGAATIGKLVAVQLYVIHKTSGSATFGSTVRAIVT